MRVGRGQEIGREVPVDITKGGGRVGGGEAFLQIMEGGVGGEIMTSMEDRIVGFRTFITTRAVTITRATVIPCPQVSTVTLTHTVTTKGMMIGEQPMHTTRVEKGEMTSGTVAAGAEGNVGEDRGSTG